MITVTINIAIAYLSHHDDVYAYRYGMILCDSTTRSSSLLRSTLFSVILVTISIVATSNTAIKEGSYVECGGHEEVAIHILRNNSSIQMLCHDVNTVLPLVIL